MPETHFQKVEIGAKRAVCGDLKVKCPFAFQVPLYRNFLSNSQMFLVSDKSGLQTGQFSMRTLLLWSHNAVTDSECAFALSC